MEAKKKNTQEAPMASQPGVPPSGNNQNNTTPILPFHPLAFAPLFICSFNYIYSCVSSDLIRWTLYSIMRYLFSEEMKLQNSAASGSNLWITEVPKAQMFPQTPNYFFSARTNERLGQRH